MRFKPDPRRRGRGFTLIELVIVIVLLGLLAVIGTHMISETVVTSMVTTNNQSSGSQARYAMERMTREIREMAFSSAGYAITTMNATTLAFSKEDETAVTLTNSGTSLTLGYNPGTTSTLSNQISSFAFSYLDQLGGATTDKEEVRFVQIAMTVANTKTGKTEALRNRVFLRNAQASP